MRRKRLDGSRRPFPFRLNWQPEGSQAQEGISDPPQPIHTQAVIPERARSFLSTKRRSNTKIATQSTIALDAPYRVHRRKNVGWIICLTALAVSGGMAIAAFLWLTSLPPLPDCQKISAVSSDADRLYCVREAARSGELPDLLAALNFVKGWTADHPLYAEANDLAEDWSSVLLSIARQRFANQDMQGAIDLAKQIPNTTPTYAKAQEAIAEWQQDWQRGEEILAAANAAIRKQDWEAASAQVLELGKLNNDYWRRDQVDQLAQQVLVEKAAWQSLTEARKLVESNNQAQFGAAIAQLRQVQPNTYAAEVAQAELTRWSRSLLDKGRQRWQRGDIAGAMLLVHPVPLDLVTDPQMRDLVEYSHAYQLASESRSKLQPSLAQIFSLMEAIAAIRTIASDSSLYAQAQVDQRNWQAQLEDLIQLQYANVTASLGQRFAFELAIEQATQIQPDRPRRLQAQTLVASWRRDIQRIEDQPLLNVARDLASGGTIPALKAAIAQASQVALGRALRIEAQTWIAAWHNQIETIEDKPFLDRAATFARQGRLSDAIREAGKIRSGRALYEDAQSQIASWRYQIRQAQIAQDRPILDDAYALADQGSLSLAIERASAIGRGRILYGEAQAAIAQWRAEREQIWQSWEAEADDNAYREDDSYSEEDYDSEESYGDDSGYSDDLSDSEESDSSYDGYYDPDYEGQ